MPDELLGTPRFHNSDIIILTGDFKNAILL